MRLVAAEFIYKSICSAIFLLFLCADANAFISRNLTLYLDGAEIEQREIARKGYLEVTLPPGALKESLRIAPGKGVTIRRVLTVPQPPAKNIEKELGLLAEREELLYARLKALSVREEIFKSAAKSQSAKAPRRTKTNPEPLSSIKQGTDYAISQLETVYHAQRKVEKELAQIAERRSRFSGEELSGGTVAKVWVTPPAGAVTVSWREAGRSWTPVYQLRVITGGSAAVSLMAQAVFLAKGEKATLVLAPLQNSENSLQFIYENEWSTLKKAEFMVTDSAEVGSSPYIVSFLNSSAFNLPPGEISCFKSGIYLGKGKFPGVDSGKTTEIACSVRQ